MKTIPIHVEDEEWKQLIVKKGKKTWREFLLDKVKEGEL